MLNSTHGNHHMGLHMLQGRMLLVDQTHGTAFIFLSGIAIVRLVEQKAC